MLIHAEWQLIPLWKVTEIAINQAKVIPQILRIVQDNFLTTACLKYRKYTLQSIIFLDPHYRHPIAHPWGWDIYSMLSSPHLIQILSVASNNKYQVHQPQVVYGIGNGKYSTAQEICRSPILLFVLLWLIIHRFFPYSTGFFLWTLSQSDNHPSDNEATMTR